MYSRQSCSAVECILRYAEQLLVVQPYDQITERANECKNIIPSTTGDVAVTINSASEQAAMAERCHTQYEKAAVRRGYLFSECQTNPR